MLSYITNVKKNGCSLLLIWRIQRNVCKVLHRYRGMADRLYPSNERHQGCGRL